MSKEEARDILKRIQHNPELIDQLTEEEVKEIELLVNSKA